jgi:hypothetical protein
MVIPGEIGISQKSHVIAEPMVGRVNGVETAARTWIVFDQVNVARGEIRISAGSTQAGAPSG